MKTIASLFCRFFERHEIYQNRQGKDMWRENRSQDWCEYSEAEFALEIRCDNASSVAASHDTFSHRRRLICH